MSKMKLKMIAVLFGALQTLNACAGNYYDSGTLSKIAAAESGASKNGYVPFARGLDDVIEKNCSQKTNATKTGKVINVNKYGSVADGKSHPLQGIGVKYPMQSNEWENGQKKKYSVAVKEYNYITEAMWRSYPIEKDWVAITKAIDVADEGDTVFINPGVYYLNDSINVHKGLNITGIKPKASDDQNNIYIVDGKASWLKFSYTRNIYKERNKNQVSRGKKPTIPTGILEVWKNNTTVSNIGIDENNRNHADDGTFTWKKDASKGRDYKRFINTYWVQNILLGKKKQRPARNIRIENVVVWDYYGHGISTFATRVKNPVINCNTLVSTFVVQKLKDKSHSGYQGIGVSGVSSAEIKYNKIIGALDDAIAIHRGADLDIAYNDIVTTTGRILVKDCENNCNITNNRIMHIHKGGASIEVGVEAEYRAEERVKGSSKVSITNNMIYVGDNVPIGVGIRILGGINNNLKIERNIIMNASRETKRGKPEHAIRIQEFSPKIIRQGQVVKTVSSPISGVKVSANYINNFDWGILIQGGKGRGETIRNVEITDNSFIEVSTPIQYKGTKGLSASAIKLNNNRSR